MLEENEKEVLELLSLGSKLFLNGEGENKATGSLHYRGIYVSKTLEFIHLKKSTILLISLEIIDSLLEQGLIEKTSSHIYQDEFGLTLKSINYLSNGKNGNEKYITMTEQIIERARSRRGSWNGDQFKVLGLSFCEPNWKKKILGKRFPAEVICKYIAVRNVHLDRKNKNNNFS
jgi:hypothetical protein